MDQNSGSTDFNSLASLGGTDGLREADVASGRTPAISANPASLARFSMSSDLRAATGLTRTHLDYYLRERLIVPTARTESGYLLFDEHEVATLQEIVRARRTGEPLRDIRARLGR